MAFTNETKNYGLPDWIGPDKPTWLVDMNNAFETIDNQMKSNETAAMQAKQIGESAMDTAGNAVEATHTNAAAISALTASLAETDTRVDSLKTPSNALISVTGTITGFGSETAVAVYVNERVKLRGFYVYGSNIKKTMLIDVDRSKGLPNYIAKVFPGKLPLFNNAVDASLGDNIAAFPLHNSADGPAINAAILRGADGYYYGLSQADYDRMTAEEYFTSLNIFTALGVTSWPTT